MQSPSPCLPAAADGEPAPHSALLAFVAAASALVLDTPNNWHANDRVTERWQEQNGDPAQFDLQLAAANNNNNNWDLANNVRTANEQASFNVPNVPAG